MPRPDLVYLQLFGSDLQARFFPKNFSSNLKLFGNVYFFKM